MFKTLRNIFSPQEAVNDPHVVKQLAEVVTRELIDRPMPTMDKINHSERASLPSRIISVRGKKFGVGLVRNANARNRWKRLSTLQVGEEMCFMEKQVTMHKAVTSYRNSWEGQYREYVINPATIEGARIPSQEVSVVTRTA